jgi:hypothetical protein
VAESAARSGLLPTIASIDRQSFVSRSEWRRWDALPTWTSHERFATLATVLPSPAQDSQILRSRTSAIRAGAGLKFAYGRTADTRCRAPLGSALPPRSARGTPTMTRRPHASAAPPDKRTSWADRQRRACLRIARRRRMAGTNGHCRVIVGQRGCRSADARGSESPHFQDLSPIPPAGFEPAISCVKGRRPRPLDHGGQEQQL